MTEIKSIDDLINCMESKTIICGSCFTHEAVLKELKNIKALQIPKTPGGEPMSKNEGMQKYDCS